MKSLLILFILTFSFQVMAAKGIAISAGGGGSNCDITVNTDQSSLTNANAAATAGDCVELMSIVSTENVSITKALGIQGLGQGSIVSGTIRFQSGSDGSSLKNLKVNGDIIIDSGVKNIIIDSIWTTGTITDNGTNNFVLGLGEE